MDKKNISFSKGNIQTLPQQPIDDAVYFIKGEQEDTGMIAIAENNNYIFLCQPFTCERKISGYDSETGFEYTYEFILDCGDSQ